MSGAVRSSLRIALQRGPQGVTLVAADALLDALQTHGYCYLQHPALPAERLSTVKATGRKFFSDLLPNLTEYQKASIATEGGFRGFYRYIGASGRDDAIDCFSIGRDDVDDDVAQLRRPYYLQAGWERGEVNSMLSRTNPWLHMRITEGAQKELPSTHGQRQLVNEIRENLVSYYDACHEVCMDVLRHVAAGLGIKVALNTGVEGPDSTIDWEYFARHHTKRDHNLEVKYYPAFARTLRARPLVPVHGASARNPNGPKVLRRRGAVASPHVEGTGVGAEAASTAAAASSPVVRLDTHRDLSTLTLLAQDQLGGLEVHDEAQDVFVPVPVMDDAVLLNAGTFLEKWTGGLLPATPHRVRCTGEADRCSVVFFCFPDHDAWIEPLLTKDDNPVLSSSPESAGFFAGDLMPLMPKPS